MLSHSQPGDEICEVNGRRFDCLTHDEAVRVLKYNHRLNLVLRDVGKVPLQQQQQVSSEQMNMSFLYGCNILTAQYLTSHHPNFVRPNI